MYLFHISVTGSHHKALGQPGQDASGSFSVRAGPLGRLLAAVACDGVSSCPRSRAGARTAAAAFLDAVRQGLAAPAAGGEDPAPRLEALLTDAMEAADRAVLDLAAREGCPPAQYDTTLCGALLLGDGRAFWCNIGDSGAVALFEDGRYALLSSRIKGPFANSVYPLRAADRRQTGSAEGVAALVLMTDGLLDHCTTDAASGSRIFWPFLAQIIRPLSSSNGVKSLKKDWQQLLAGKCPYYQKYTLPQIVGDDLTICVMARNAPEVHRALGQVQWPGAARFRAGLMAARRALWGDLYTDGEEAADP